MINHEWSKSQLVGVVYCLWNIRVRWRSSESAGLACIFKILITIIALVHSVFCTDTRLRWQGNVSSCYRHCNVIYIRRLQTAVDLDNFTQSSSFDSLDSARNSSQNMEAMDTSSDPVSPSKIDSAKTKEIPSTERMVAMMVGYCLQNFVTFKFYYSSTCQKAHLLFLRPHVKMLAWLDFQTILPMSLTDLMDYQRKIKHVSCKSSCWKWINISMAKSTVTWNRCWNVISSRY